MRRASATATILVEVIAMDAETVVIAVFWALYPVPALIAWLRNVRHAPAITAIDVFLAWTIVGWVVALVWALKDSRSAQVDQPSSRHGAVGELVAALLVWAVIGIVCYFVFIFLAVAGGGMETFPGWLDASFLGGFAIMVWVPAVLAVRSTLRRWRHGMSPYPFAH
jgi:T4 superinfection immunity protein